MKLFRTAEQKKRDKDGQDIMSDMKYHYQKGNVEEACKLYEVDLKQYKEQYHLDNNQMIRTIAGEGFNQVPGHSYNPLVSLVHPSYFAFNSDPERAAVLKSLLKTGANIDNFTLHQVIIAERFAIQGSPAKNIVDYMIENYPKGGQFAPFSVYTEHKAKTEGVNNTLHVLYGRLQKNKCAEHALAAFSNLAKALREDYKNQPSSKNIEQAIPYSLVRQ